MISSILISRSFGSIKIITLGMYLTNNKFIPKVGYETIIQPEFFANDDVHYWAIRANSRDEQLEGLGCRWSSQRTNWRKRSTNCRDERSEGSGHRGWGWHWEGVDKDLVGHGGGGEDGLDGYDHDDTLGAKVRRLLVIFSFFFQTLLMKLVVITRPISVS